jgi:hypothetical protein
MRIVGPRNHKRPRARWFAARQYLNVELGRLIRHQSRDSPDATELARIIGPFRRSCKVDGERTPRRNSARHPAGKKL